MNEENLVYDIFHFIALQMPYHMPADIVGKLPIFIHKLFVNLRQLSVDIMSKNIDNVSMGVLSMGMTGDYMTALEEAFDMNPRQNRNIFYQFYHFVPVRAKFALLLRHIHLNQDSGFHTFLEGATYVRVGTGIFGDRK